MKEEPLLEINKKNMLVVAIVMVMHGILVGGIFSMIYRVSECGLC